MFKKIFCLTLATLVVFSMSVAVASADTAAESAADSFKQGNELLKQGKFEAALKAFHVAAKAEPQNKQYMFQFSQVRYMFILQNRLDKEQDPKKWMQIAGLLHALYLRHNLLDSALELDTKVYAKEKSFTSGLMLAETQMAMKRYDAAAKTLSGLPAEVKQSDWVISALYSIALARDGKTADAQKAAAAVQLPKEPQSGRAFIAANVKVIEGDRNAALALLVQAFETTPPSRLGSLKAEVKESPELASLASIPAFAQVMETQSKVPESSCSGGSSCASCPNRGKCQGGGGGQKSAPSK